MKSERYIWLCSVVALLAAIGTLGAAYYYSLKGMEQVTAELEKQTEELITKVSHFEEKLEAAPKHVPPTEVEITTLRKNILEILGDKLPNYSVGIQSIKTGQTLFIDGDKDMPPASVSKLPYAILVLQDIQNGKIALDDTINNYSFSRAYPSDPLYHRGSRGLTYRTLLTYLIRNSDNTAMMTLERHFGGRDKFNERVKKDLQVNLTRDPHITTSKDVLTLLSGIAKGEYLNYELNHFLIYELMGKTDSYYDDRIVAGVTGDEFAFVAHKIGAIISTQTGFTYHDAGIVYGPWDDVAIVVLNKKTTGPDATRIISQISQEAYKTFNQQE